MSQLVKYALYKKPTGFTDGDWDGGRYTNEQPLQQHGYMIRVPIAQSSDLEKADRPPVEGYPTTETCFTYYKSDVVDAKIEKLEKELHKALNLTTSNDIIFANMLTGRLPKLNKEQIKVLIDIERVSND